jgi:hypothetical protein
LIQPILDSLISTGEIRHCSSLSTQLSPFVFGVLGATSLMWMMIIDMSMVKLNQAGIVVKDQDDGNNSSSFALICSHYIVILHAGFLWK